MTTEPIDYYSLENLHIGHGMVLSFLDFQIEVLRWF